MFRPLGLAIFVAAAMAAAPASAKSIDEGTYTCMYYIGDTLLSMGDIEITGDSYRGPAYDGKYGPSYDYELTDDGYIVWRGPLGGLTSDGNQVGTSTFEDGSIAIQILPADGRPWVIGCDR